MRKNIKIFLTVSILLNVFLIGIVAGGFLNHGIKGDFLRDSRLSPESQNIVARSMSDARQNARDDLRAAKAARREMTNILKERDFDAEAYDAVMERVLTAQDKIARSHMEAMGKIAQELSPEERAVFAQDIRGFMRRNKPRRMEPEELDQK